MGELQAEAYEIQYKWNKISIVRPANVYGPYDNFDPENAMVIPSLINRACSGERPLVVWGDGTPVRDFIHVMDLADGHILALEYLKNNEPMIKDFNLGTGVGTSVLELINTFQAVNNIEIPFIFLDRRKGDIAKVIADNSLAIKELNWMPKRNLDDMCRDGWNWQNQNPNGFVNK